MDDGRRRLEVYPPIHRLGPVGRLIRRQLLKGILGGTPVIMGMQRLRTPPVNTIVGAISFMGEEEFYTLLLPLIIWIFEARMGHLLTLLMATAFYCTGFLKNSLCLPRPPIPPTTPLHQCKDWSLPSHHALLAVNVPWYIWFYADRHYSLDLGPNLMTLLFLSVSMWSFFIMFGRMYLGVHSPADVLTGGVVGCLLLAGWLQVDLSVDQFISNSGSSVVLLVVTFVCVMLYIHPDPSPTTIIYTDTVSMMGVAAGVVLGQLFFSKSIMIAILERKILASAWTILGQSLARSVLGIIAVAVIKIFSKIVFREPILQLCKVAGIPAVCQSRESEVTFPKIHYSKHFVTLEKPPVQDPIEKEFRWSTSKPLNVNVLVSLLTYVLLGITMVGIMPYLFLIIGI